MNIQYLQPGILAEVYDFLTVKDFVRTLCCSKALYTENCIYSRSIWIKLISKKWGLPARDILHLAFDKSVNFSVLYPLARMICHELYSDDIGLQCVRNTATFVGFVGEGNQSVQSVEAFPQIYAAEEGGLLGLIRREVFPCFSLSGGVRGTVDRLRVAASNVISKARATVSHTTDVTPSFSIPFVSISSGSTPSSIVSSTDTSTRGEDDDSSRSCVGDHNTTINIAAIPLYHAVNVLPKPIAYYEVRIAKVAARELQQQQYNSQSSSYTTGLGLGMGGFMPQLETTAVTECVAVGLATRGFLRQKRLPGWDNESFGYHGDDGAIFHGRGRQLSSYGPSFGYGDTVGCGIDYRDRSVFFTVNGKYLGTAFRDLKGGLSLHPTVGIDAAARVSFNFGREPFEFDLLEHIANPPIAPAVVDEFDNSDSI